MAATPAQKSMIAIWVASKPSLSRSEGSEPPKPPITTPLTTKSNVTAIAASRVASWLVMAAEVVIRRFCIDLEGKSLLYARMAADGKKRTAAGHA
jgi:hypothetical protein